MLLFGSRWSGRGKEIQEGNFLFKAGGRQGQLGSASFISIDYRMKSSIFRDFPILTSTGSNDLLGDFIFFTSY